MAYTINPGVLLLVMSGVAITAYAEVNNADSTCNPVVKLDSSDTTIATALQHLAEKHQFALSFPKELDQPVQLEDAMPLDQMIRFLTRDMNTAMQHKTIAGCASPRLAELMILPTGEESEFINVAAPQEDQQEDQQGDQQEDQQGDQQGDQQEDQQGGQQPVEHIYIENMDLFAEEVLLKKREADINQMTAEQRQLFMEARKRIRKKLVDEGLLNNKEKLEARKQLEQNDD